MTQSEKLGGHQVHIPDSAEVSDEDVWNWYLNIATELSDLPLSEDEHIHLEKYYLNAGLLHPQKVEYFRSHFAKSFSRAAAFLLKRSEENPNIVDLGGGAATQSIYFAIKGARVTLIDMDELSLSVARKRIDYYERTIGRKLEINLLAANCHDVDWTSISPIDGVYSMFAFNMMQPSSALIKAIAEASAPFSRCVIIDGNRKSWMGRFVPSRRRNVLAPIELADEFRNAGYLLIEHEGCIALPPVAWDVLPRRFVEKVDQFLCRNWFFSISHQIFLKKSN